MIIQLFFAFAGGVLSFLSPCVLPLVPVYISFMSGVSIYDADKVSEGRRQIILTALAFVLGFSTVFILLGASATAIGAWLRDYQVLISQIGGVFIIILSLHLMGVFRINALLKEARINAGSNWKPGPGMAYLTGMVFAFGWTPCIGPILGSILVLAAKTETITKGIVLLTAYSLGLGIPFLAVAFATGYSVSAMNSLKRHFRKIEIASGALLLIMGILLVTNTMTIIATKLANNPVTEWLDSLQPRVDFGGPEFVEKAPLQTDGGIDAALTALDGAAAKISDYRGKVVLLNYWAPWCGPCKQEMPLLSALHERMEPEGFVVVGVTLDYDSTKEVADIVSERGVKYPVFLGGNEAEKAVPAFQGFPANFLLDQQGNIVASRQGEFTDTVKLEAKINELLEAATP